MCKRNTAVRVLFLIVLMVLPVGAVFGYMYFRERQRLNDADPAFRPIAKLRCHISDQPLPFHRYCRYVVEFPPDSSLCDANIVELQSLNRLPRACILDVTIERICVTDRSLPHLLTLNTFDSLDVKRTSITDDGIEKLQKAFPEAIIPSRK